MTPFPQQSIPSIKAAYSTLQAADLLKNVVPQYDLPGIYSCEFWQQGQNDTYKLSTKKENYILRVYGHGRSRSAIEFELEALLYLHKQGATVAYPIPRQDGHWITTILAPEGERSVIVTAYAPGKILRFDKPQDATLFGQAIAKVHRYAAGFQPIAVRAPLDLDHLVHQPLITIQPYLAHRPTDWQFLSQFAKDLVTRVRDVANYLDYGFCHGDCHGENAHGHQGVVTHFDFDCCGFGWRSYDLATFKWVIKQLGKEELLWQSFLGGYQSVREISELDVSMVETFMAIRDIWFFGLNTGNSLAQGWLNDRYMDIHLNFLRALSDENISVPGV